MSQDTLKSNQSVFPHALSNSFKFKLQRRIRQAEGSLYNSPLETQPYLNNKSS